MSTYIESEKVFEIVQIQIPDLREKIEVFIKDGIANSDLSAFELELSIGSEFYSHVNFENLRINNT